MAMEKIDHKKTLKSLYSGKIGVPVLVDVPPLQYLMVDGQGDPNTSQQYVDAIQALYPVSYALKFKSKKELGKDYVVMPLEALWWSDDMSDFLTGKKASWHWTAMILQPEFITGQMLQTAVDEVRKKSHPAAIDKLRLSTYHEGRAAQVMYQGPYADEGPTILKLHQFIDENGGSVERSDKHHHEIYLGDPRRADPATLKTVIRQPF